MDRVIAFDLYQPGLEFCHLNHFLAVTRRNSLPEVYQNLGIFTSKTLRPVLDLEAYIAESSKVIIETRRPVHITNDPILPILFVSLEESTMNGLIAGSSP